MTLSAQAATASEIAPWRVLYREEMNCQILHDSFFSRAGWTEAYLLRVGGTEAGYGAYVVAGPWKGTRTIFEFYVAPRFRTRAYDLFSELRTTHHATGMRAQTNDVLLSAMLLTHGRSFETEKIVFHDVLATRHEVSGATFRRVTPEESAALSARGDDPLPEWALEVDGGLAATGGILWHYNRPYGDLYMNVEPPLRRRGLGRYLLQELKAQCYREGGRPCARCDPSNVASIRTLQAAGFVPCANLVTARFGPPG
jgi:GNAT superfamily N-acetyltransferase